MRNDLKKIHEEVQNIYRDSQELSHSKYTSEQVLKLQERLHSIDTQYREGIVQDRDKSNPNDDPYEHRGQGQVADDIAKAHDQLTKLLQSASD